MPPTESSPDPLPTDQLRVLVAVCTYNERENLPVLLPQISAVLPTADIYVVDDDSPDGTGEWARQTALVDHRLSVLVRTGQRGLGGALKAAIVHAVEQQYDFMLNLDGDLSHQPSDLPRLLAAARAVDPPYDVVVGSRYVAEGRIDGWPLHRKIMSRLVNGFATRMLRLPVKDCSGALRCYRVESLRRLDLAQLRCEGYAMLEELLMLLQRNGARMSEIPITFHDRQQGDSKLTTGETIRSVRGLLRMMFR